MSGGPSIEPAGRDEPVFVEDSLFRQFAENIPALGWIANPDGYIFWYNRRWHDYCGTTPEDMAGWGWQAVHDPALLSGVIDAWQASLAAGSDFEMTFPLRGADGLYRLFLTRVTALKDDAGKVCRWFGVNFEITAQVEAERALERSEQQLRQAINASSGLGTWHWDLDTDKVRADAAFAETFGVDPERARLGVPIEEFFAAIDPADRDRVTAAIEEAVASLSRFEQEYRITLTEGETRWVVSTGQAVADANGKPISFPGMGFDVTTRKRAEIRQAALLDLADRLRDLTDQEEVKFAASEVLGHALGVARAGYGGIDTARETIHIARDWNAPGIESIAGTLHFRDYGSYIDDLNAGRTVAISDARADPRTAPTAGALEAISARSFVNMPVIEQGGFVALMYVNHDQPKVWHEQDLLLMRDIAERVRAATERLNAEQARRASEEQFRVFAQTIPNQLWAAHPNGDLYWFNRQVVDYSGVDQDRLSGSGWGTLVHADDLARAGAAWAHALATGDIYEVEFRIRRHDGEYRWFLVRAEPTRDKDGTISGWVGTNTEIEEQRRQASALQELAETLESQVNERTAELMSAEEALRQSQKMEAVGQLTGGLAHDFNNLLTAISGGLEMISLRVSQGRGDDIERYAAAAQTAAKRAAALTHRLLAFSRRQTLDPRPTDVNRLIGGMEELASRTLGPAITLEVVGSAGLWPTLVDPNQLENALLNLVINARDAMPQGGRLTIETANRWLDPRAARERSLRPGQYVSLCVSDTGSGMTPDVIAKAFDPFFTTKPLGLGTGLGLSMIYGFVRQSGGQVRIYSDEGAGTMVCLYLPRHNGPIDDAAIAASATTMPRAVAGETVLVVDDEAGIRMLLTDTLDELGYRSLEAEDGAQGLEILRSEARIDLLVTDVGLPGGMNGRQMADAGRQVRPDLKVLFITGYAENAVFGNGQLDHGMHVMTKPFELDSLGRRIKELIEE